jgi:hypothetical protein
MVGGLAKLYGQIRFVKRGDQVGYRADRCDETGDLTVLVRELLHGGLQTAAF